MEESLPREETCEAKMNEDHHRPRHHPSPRKNYPFSTSATVLLFFFLGYSLGFFSASTSSTTSTPPSILPPLLITPPPAVIPAQEEKLQAQPQLPAIDGNHLFRFRTGCSPPMDRSSVVPKILHHVYNDVSPYVNFPPAHLTPLLLRNHSFLHGWGSTGAVFQDLISKLRPKTIIEIGTFLGASALHMASLTRGDDTLILCLDDFRGWPGLRDAENENHGRFKNLPDVNGDVVLMQQFMQNVMDAREEGRVIPVPFSTAAGLAALCDWGVYADLIEVDAGHDFHSAWADINMAWEVLAAGGVLFGHDYNLWVYDFGVRRAVDLFAKVKGLKVEVNEEHWVLWPPKK